MNNLKNSKKTKSHGSLKAAKGQRLGKKEREKQIINEAINYFCNFSDYDDKLLIATHNEESVKIGLDKNNKNIQTTQGAMHV